MPSILLTAMLAVAAAGFFDSMRGRSHGVLFRSRPFTSLYTALTIQPFLIASGISPIDVGLISTIVALGIYLGVVIGWSKYFAAFQGNYDLTQKDFWPADIVGDAVFRWTKLDRLAGTIAMSIRHIMFYPLFMGLAVIDHSTIPLLYGIGVLMGGPIYAAVRLVPPVDYLLFAEPARGGWIMLLIILSL